MIRLVFSLLAFGVCISQSRADELADLIAYAKETKSKHIDWEGKPNLLEMSEHITDTDLTKLAKIAPKSLLKLDLSHCEKITDAGFLALPAIKTLRFLSVPAQLTDKAYGNVANRFPAVSFININNLERALSPITTKSLHCFAQLKDLGQISVCKASTDDTCWNWPNSRILSLHIKSCKLTGVGVSKLNNSKPLYVKFTNLPLTENGVKEIGSLSCVNNLQLKNCSITDAGLSGWAKNASFEYIHLEDDTFTDNAISHFTTMPKLRELDLENTKLTNRTLDSLSGVASLKILSLSSKFSDTDIVRFKQANLNVKFREPRANYVSPK